MNYTVYIKREAQKKLQSFSKPDRLKITEKIMQLGFDPKDVNLDIKPLQGEPYYRLRVGNWRIIFDKKDDIKVINIEKIKPRGDAYK